MIAGLEMFTVGLNIDVSKMRLLRCVGHR
jgi:hypothetical protein